MDKFWEAIDAQLALLTKAATAADVIKILGGAGEKAFFAGSGGDGTVFDALRDAGWATETYEASYYWCLKAPNGDLISYVEGDVYVGNMLIGEADQ